jgi:hypothetical protein
MDILTPTAWYKPCAHNPLCVVLCLYIKLGLASTSSFYFYFARRHHLLSGKCCYYIYLVIDLVQFCREQITKK